MFGKDSHGEIDEDDEIDPFPHPLLKPVRDPAKTSSRMGCFLQ